MCVDSRVIQSDESAAHISEDSSPRRAMCGLQPNCRPRPATLPVSSRQAGNTGSQAIQAKQEIKEEVSHVR